MRFLIAMIVVFVLSLGTAVEAQIKPPSGGPMYRPTVAPAPAPAPKPIKPVAIKRRWRVDAIMRHPNGSWRAVYITWYGFPNTIDWATAAVCEYITYRFLSPWERWGATFESFGPPVDDMNTPH